MPSAEAWCLRSRPHSPKCSMALDGPPRSHENGAAAKAIFTPVPRKREFSEVRSYKRAAVCASQAPYRDPHSLARPLLAIDGYVRVENPLRAVASCYGPTSPRISMVGPLLVCLVGKSPTEEEGRTLSGPRHERRTTENEPKRAMGSGCGTNPARRRRECPNCWSGICQG